VKGGAQLLNAKKFIQSCESLEKEQDLQNKISSFQKLLEEQNQVIKRYQTKYAAP
jgi:two-component system sensor histidine kinase EvgS